MGGAILKSWFSEEDPEGVTAKNVFVVDPLLKRDLSPVRGINIYDDLSRVPDLKCDILLIAIKPQDFEKVLSGYNKFIDKNKTLIISIAAGKTIGSLENIFGKDASIIRAMPNLPATISESITAYYANDIVDDTQIEYAEHLMETFGMAVEVKEENLIDVITAVSGSGPAFFFYFMECMIAVAKKMGIEDDNAALLVAQTAAGSSLMARNILFEEWDYSSIKQMREAVTSPKGTTEAGLNILMDGRLQNIVEETMNAALKRAKELNS